ncbi:MAG: S1C family serine protease, partial [Candidatus Omnitrophica bacterium]|nr:S1C family serine protease [Candidatus Omnitrophota bacterium]
EPGEKIFAVGVTSSLPYIISNGLFNSKRKLFSRNLLQFTAPIPSGGMGAPLLDIYGNVIGIIAFGSRSGSDLNFAIPMDKGIKDFVEDSIKKTQERGLTEIFEHFQRTEEYYKAAVGYDQKWKQKQHDTADCFRHGNCGGDNCTQAIEYYEKTFRTGVLAPDDIQRLGLLYCWCRNDFDKGISYMKTAIEFDPGIGSTADYYTEAMETKISTLLLEYEYGEAKKWKARYQQDLEELSLFIPDVIANIRANSKILNMDWGKLPKKPSGK